MGYNSTATTITLTAKLTPYGRQALLSNGITTISSFSLGDSDANYNVQYPLSTGQVPSSSGNISVTSCSANSTTNNVSLRSQLLYNSLGAVTKPINSNAFTVNAYQQSLGLIATTGATCNFINRNNTQGTANTLTNLFFSFGLPINQTDKAYFSSLTHTYGGFADTALSGLNQDNILVIAIDNSKFGEIIDGKTIHTTLVTSAGTYNIYGTYKAGREQLTGSDSEIEETDPTMSVIGNNICFLFCDTIKKPNGNGSLSWSTGWNTYKPFSVNHKSLFNYLNNTNLGLSADTAVGVAYLDKGFIVITNPTIVSNFNLLSASTTTISFNSYVTKVSYDVTCVVNRGEFQLSNNPTFVNGDTPRVSEIALYDSSGNLIAIAKTDEHVELSGPSFAAFSISIVL